MSKKQDRADFVRLLASLLPVYNCGIEQAVTHADEALSLVKERFPDEPLEAMGAEAVAAAPVGDGRPTKATAEEVSIAWLSKRLTSGEGVIYEEPTVPAPVETAGEDGVERVTLAGVGGASYVKRPQGWRLEGESISASVSSDVLQMALDELLAQRKRAEAAEAEAEAVNNENVKIVSMEASWNMALVNETRRAEAANVRADAEKVRTDALEAALPHWRAIAREAEGYEKDRPNFHELCNALDAARAAGLTWEG